MKQIKPNGAATRALLHQLQAAKSGFQVRMLLGKIDASTRGLSVSLRESVMREARRIAGSIHHP